LCYTFFHLKHIFFRQKKYDQAITTLKNGIETLSGRVPAKLHPIHVRACKWPDWLNEGIAQLEKITNDITTKAKDFELKRIELEKKKKLQKEEAVQKKEKEKMEAKKLKEENEEKQKQEQLNATGSTATLTKQQQIDMQEIVTRRRDLESKHRSTRAEKEKLINDYNKIQTTLSALRGIEQDDDDKSTMDTSEESEGVGGSGVPVEHVRKQYAAVGKMFVVKSSEDVLKEMILKEKSMKERLNVLKSRDENLVLKLESIQKELNEMIAR